VVGIVVNGSAAGAAAGDPTGALARNEGVPGLSDNIAAAMDEDVQAKLASPEWIEFSSATSQIPLWH